MTSAQNLTPVEIDTELSRLWTEQSKVTGWILAHDRHEARFPQTMPHRISENARARADLVARLTAIRAASAPFEAEYKARGGWNRYFLVTNSNGHVHRGMDCSTCFQTTEYSWIVDLADCDEDAMIEEYGELACTVCFPTAPANPKFHAPGSRTREALAAKQAEKDAKAQAKADKAITAPDGSRLMIGTGKYRDEIRTKVAAQRALSDAVQSFGYYGPTHPSDFLGRARQLVEALTAVGIDPEPIIERATKKVRKDTGGDFHKIPDASLTA